MTPRLATSANGLYERYEGDPEKLTDVSVANVAVDYIREHAADVGSMKFMLNVGFYQPHVPWVVPSEYYDLYPLAEVALPITRPDDRADIPADAPPPTPRFLELSSAGEWPDLVQAYLASVTFMDAQLGRILDEVESHPDLAADTTIVVVGDHGQYIGEKEQLNKEGLWEEALNAPVLIVDPDYAGGRTVGAPVSFADIAPTVLGLADLPVPPTVEGRSLVPLMDDPSAPWSETPVSFDLDGVSIRTGRFRYTLYDRDGEELYDLVADRHEFDNLATDTAYANTKAYLRSRLGTYLAQHHYLRPQPGATTSRGTSADETLPDMGRPMTLVGGAGDDIYLVKNASTRIYEAQAAGFDTIALAASPFTIPANVEDLYTLYGFSDYFIRGNSADNRIACDGTATNEVHAGSGNDTLRCQEGTCRFYGDAGNDTLTSGSKPAAIDGGDGNDSVSGGSGADTLTGGPGVDTIVGGPGADRLTGGSGNDVFRYGAPGDCPVTARDVIADFEGAGATAGDVIDLSGIDADTTVSGNQAFGSLLHASAFTGFTSLRQLVVTDEGGSAVVYGNTDADLTTAEFSIMLTNVPAASMSSSDFLL